MRHASIKTTMDYYANVDEAAMDAVLGPKRNRLRDKTGDPNAAPISERGASDCGGIPTE
jgi:hypothetical protein